MCGSAIISSTFTDRFKAIWENIILTIENNKTIEEIREISGELDKDNKDKDINLFIVSQKKKFLFNADLQIYAMTEIYFDNSKGNNDDKKKDKMDRFMITLYSYTTPLNDIIKYVDEITHAYTSAIEFSRKNQKFIYTIAKTTYEDHPYECWNEYPFESTRTFENIFFNGKNEIMEKINFFIENKEWYYKMGIPYSIGIGLHGSPGTGKTSLIKCIANMTRRHIVIISLKMLKTRNKLNEFFFENRYNKLNKKHSIDFHNKIIVFEDIDCVSEIVHKRQTHTQASASHTLAQQTLAQQPLEKLEGMIEPKKMTEKEEKKIMNGLMTKVTTPEDEPITLDDILNIWDGIQETPGRIMIISSNHYHELDPALIRPGRIDITLEMKNASHEVITQMYEKYYNMSINKNELKKIENEFYSPAEIINFYVLHKNNPKKFMERLMENKKL